eukprot:Nk52_evm4s340 gene=Nk52_evmTU4s340
MSGNNNKKHPPKPGFSSKLVRSDTQDSLRESLVGTVKRQNTVESMIESAIPLQKMDSREHLLPKPTTDDSNVFRRRSNCATNNNSNSNSKDYKEKTTSALSLSSVDVSTSRSREQDSELTMGKVRRNDTFSGDYYKFAKQQTRSRLNLSMERGLDVTGREEEEEEYGDARERSYRDGVSGRGEGKEGTGMSGNESSTWYSNISAAFAALGGFLFGYDQGVISGIIVMEGFMDKFQIDTSNGDTTEVSWLVSSLLLAASISSVFAGSVADRFGRHWCLILATVVFFISCALQAGAETFALLLGGRVFSGFAVGVLSVVVPMYIAEIAPTSVRGRLVTYQQFANGVGILTSYGVVTITGRMDEGWRYSMGFQCVLAFIFACGMFLLPESPRWLVQKNRTTEALYVLKKVNGTDNVMDEFDLIVDTIDSEQSNTKSAWAAAFARDVRFRLFVGVTLQGLNPLMGYNAVIIYSPLIFDLLKFDKFTTTLILGAINLCGIMFGLYFVDRAGRKIFLLPGALLMMVFSLLIAVFNMYENLQNSDWIVVLLSCYVFVYGISWLPGGWLIASEIYPARARGPSISMASFANLFFSWLVAYIAPIVIDGHNDNLPYLFFGFSFFCLLGFLHVFIHIPETKMVSLEDMDEIFKVNSFKEYVPYIRQTAREALNKTW